MLEDILKRIAELLDRLGDWLLRRWRSGVSILTSSPPSSRFSKPSTGSEVRVSYAGLLAACLVLALSAAGALLAVHALTSPKAPQTDIATLLQARLPLPEEQLRRHNEIVDAIKAIPIAGKVGTSDISAVLRERQLDHDELNAILRALTQHSSEEESGPGWPALSVPIIVMLTSALLIVAVYRANNDHPWAKGATLLAATATFTLSSLVEIKDLTLFRHEGALFEYKYTYVPGPSGVSEVSTALSTPQGAGADQKTGQSGPVVPRCDTAASRRLGPFGDGDPQLHAQQRMGLDDIVAGFLKMQAQTASRRLAGIVLTGSVDKRGLRGSSLRLYHTNAELAYARAANTGTTFFGKWGGGIEVDNVSEVAARLLDAHSSLKLAPERSVTICPVWAAKP